MLELYQNLPLHISPIAFMVGSFAVRWYALSYIVGFFSVYLLLRWRIKKGEYLPVISHQSSVINKPKGNDGRLLNADDIFAILVDYLLLVFFSSLIGGRIGYVIFYNFNFFLSHPLAIISPFDPSSGNFVGFFGMSYHGALIGVIIASWIFLKKKKIDFLCWADFIVPAVPLAYTFGRLGNFLNGELYGRQTSSIWGMHFIGQSTLRYPSQLIEALLEGILLFVLLWPIRNKKFEKGFLFGLYLVGYSLARIISEQFREPDPQLGFLFWHITMGQILSILMLIFGVYFFQKKKKVVY